MKLSNLRKFINKNNIKKLFNNIKKTIIDFVLLFYFVFLREINDKNFKIITISDSTHYKSLLNLLNSLRKYEKNTEVVLYDIGMTKAELSFIEHKYDCIIKKFDFSQYPEFFSKRDEFNKLGSYAWKPVILEKEYLIGNKNIIYLDAGCLITKKLRIIKFIVKKNGFYSPESSNKIKDWTHPDTLSFMNVDNKFLNKRNFSSGLIGLGLRNDIQKLVTEWSKYSQIKDVIAPIKSSRLNHRQDQSVLTILIHKNLNNYYIPRTHWFFGLRKHQDAD